MQIINPVRAKRAWIETERIDKAGRKPSKVKQDIVISKGMFSGKEMEKQMSEIAREQGVSEDKIHIETYANGEAPIEANPRHRGTGQHWEKRPTEVTEVKDKPIRIRRVFSGLDLPKTEEEKAALIKEFERRFHG